MSFLTALLCAARGMTVDKSAQHAYIHAIRKAERFIYIENQCVPHRVHRVQQ